VPTPAWSVSLEALLPSTPGRGLYLSQLEQVRLSAEDRDGLRLYAGRDDLLASWARAGLCRD
jgi:hypothetical protein